LSRYTLHVRRELDWETVSQAAALLAGTHDMAAFAGSGLGVPGPPDQPGDEAAGKPSTVRTMHLARLVPLPNEASFWDWEAPEPNEERIVQSNGRLMAFDLVANAFLPQMVRTIVGTLIEVGQGKRTVDNITDILNSRDRRLAGPTAKPHGLCLLWVEY
jgi:tRNA pseudouridine38-40 synthase